MTWKTKTAAVLLAWITIPWTWSIALEQGRRHARRKGASGDAAEAPSGD